MGFTKSKRKTGQLAVYTRYNKRYKIIKPDSKQLENSVKRLQSSKYSKAARGSDHLKQI